jgi:tRNA threonylcarbamoyladenosine modification (KEOPS) complex Cgi121 subunit
MSDLQISLDLASRIHIVLLKNVTNSSDIYNYLFDEAGELKDKYFCGAVVDLSLVVSIFHLQMSSYRALSNILNNSMKTKCPYTEILYCLSTSKRITESISYFNVKKDSENIAIVDLMISDLNVNASMPYTEIKNNIPQPIADILDEEEFNSFMNSNEVKMKNICNIFKIHAAELENTSMEDILMTRIACKDHM